MRTALIAAALAVLSSTAAVAETAPASTSVRFVFETGAPTGKVMVALYNSAEAYSGGAPVKAVQVDVAAGRVIVTPPAGLFEELPAEDGDEVAPEDETDAEATASDSAARTDEDDPSEG